MSKISDEELTQAAVNAGLEKFLSLYPASFSAAMESAKALAGRTERPAHISVEPAHTCTFQPNQAEKR
jgi:hypothetical protein